MRKFVCLSCALFLGVPVLAQQSAAPAPHASNAPAPANPVTVDQVQQLMDLTGTAAMQKQVMHNMMPTLQKAMPP